MTKAIKSVVVVGGGTAGWLSAGLIAAQHRANSPEGIQVTLVESPTIATVGVGEGTWPTMRSTLMKLGISETEFMRSCDATFKQGAKFARWVTGKADDFYYHPLMLPQSFGQANLAPHWQKTKSKGPDRTSFSQALCFQEALCESGLAPKMITTPEFKGMANYAYHLNAGKFVELLQKHCTKKLGVKHILADVTQVETAENGDIVALNATLSTAEKQSIKGDLFVDCSGFRSLLIGEHYQVPFVDCCDTLFIDKALAVQVPYDHPQADIASHTISTAQDAGWIWDIGLSHRRGVGHVYSTRHSSEEQALKALQDYVGPAIDSFSIREIDIRSGHR